MSSPAALSIDDVSFNYGKRRALDHVSFSVQRGETVILLGPNGAGKSTLFAMICGLFRPQSGSISICGQSIARDGASALAPLGIVFQQQTLDLDLTVRQNLTYFCKLRGLDQTTAAERVDGALKQLNMAERIDEKVRALNGGHRRRVEIARASLHQPDVLLLDEPTVGLDIPTRRALIADLHARAITGTAMLWATHLIDEVTETDRVVVLHHGRIVADGLPVDLCRETGTTDLDAAFAHLTGLEMAA